VLYYLVSAASLTQPCLLYAKQNIFYWWAQKCMMMPLWSQLPKREALEPSPQQREERRRK
jgi:hypothetical protein